MNGAAHRAHRSMTSGFDPTPVRSMLDRCANHHSEGVMILTVPKFTVLNKITAPTCQYQLFERSHDW